jgi:hypothetical protein
MSSNKLSTTVDTSTPGLSDLGWGINAATGSLLSAYVQPIVDTSKLSGLVERADLIQTSAYTNAAENGNSYLTNQTLSVGISGGYAGFSGTLSTAFGLTSGGESTDSLATYSQLTQLYQLTIPSSSVQGILTEQFQNDLETMEVPELYKTYGAYFTSTVIVGGMLSSSIQTNQSSQYSGSTMSAAASAAFNEGIANAEVKTEYTYEDTSTKTTYTCSTGLQVIGGTVSSTSAPFDIDAWTNTISANPAVVGYGPQGLTPLWELATRGSQRQTDLKNGLAAYFSAYNGYTLDPLSLKLFNASTDRTTGPETATVSVDPGYKVLCVGASLLNQDNNNQFLTNCFVVKPSDENPTPNQCNAQGKSVHTATNADLTIYAIAVYDPNDLLDVKVFTNDSGTTHSGYPAASVNIEDGYVMTGGGVSTTPDNENGLMLIASQPSSKTSWYGFAAEHSSGCTGTLTVYAIGVKWKDPTGKPKLQTDITSATSAPSGAPAAAVGVGSNCTLVGGGAWVGGNNSNNIMLQDSYPDESDAPANWKVQGHDSKTSASNPITAYAIGLQVTSNGHTVPFGPGCQSAT